MPHPFSEDGRASQYSVTAATGGDTRHRHAVRLWADLEAPWALWMMAGHFSRRNSLLFSKKPSLRGTPWEPSGKVKRPEEEREGREGAGEQGAAPSRAGGPEQEVLDGVTPGWSRRGLWLPAPRCWALTQAIHTPAFELALEGHVVAASEDAHAVELALHKLPLVPAWEEALGQQPPPAASGDAWEGLYRGATLTWSHRRR